MTDTEFYKFQQKTNKIRYATNTLKNKRLGFQICPLVSVDLNCFQLYFICLLNYHQRPQRSSIGITVLQLQLLSIIVKFDDTDCNLVALKQPLLTGTDRIETHMICNVQ